MSIPSMSAEEHFLDFGFQYYVAGRCGVRANLSPVTGNLFHHAIEMFLKAKLSQSMSSKDMQSLGHRLARLWNEFKKKFPLESLDGFDGLVKVLGDFETIRYPDEIMANGAEIVIALDRTAARSTSRLGNKPEPRYEVVVAEIDELIEKILTLSSRNPVFFTQRLNAYAREAVQYQNNRENFFLPGPDAECGMMSA